MTSQLPPLNRHLPVAPPVSGSDAGLFLFFFSFVFFVLRAREIRARPFSQFNRDGQLLLLLLRRPRSSSTDFSRRSSGDGGGDVGFI